MEIKITLNVTDSIVIDIPFIAKWVTRELLGADGFRSAVIEGDGELIEIVRRGD